MPGSHITNFCLVLPNRKYPFLIICVLPPGSAAILVAQRALWLGWGVTSGRRRTRPQALVGSVSARKEGKQGATGTCICFRALSHGLSGVHESEHAGVTACV